MLRLGLAAAAVVAVGSTIAVTMGSAVTAPAGISTRTYYIAADEVNWDYAPTGINQITGQPFDDVANVFVKHGPERIGKVYVKSQYREYTDGTFTKLKTVPAKWKHLGILGPVIQAQVGETIKVVFKNNTTKDASVHPHGVFYNKDSEGAPYNDGTTGADKADDAVPPGGTHVYTWKVPQRAGPGPHDGDSVMWMYHSHVDEPGDTNAGLIGPMIIYAPGTAVPDPTYPGHLKSLTYDREFVVNFSVMDENTSIHIDDNIAKFLPGVTDPEALKADDGFIESNLMHSINGYVYGNLPGLTMTQGENVRWYVMAMGTEVDLHTPHFHGNTVLNMGMRTDVLSLLPAQMITVDMQPDNPGTWLLHCHVNDHIVAGMQALYKVLP
jgi:FtsP/CotA-like multicopper oxidase with cupredoxin domain